MPKIVINSTYGGFNISQEGFEWLIEKGVPVVGYFRDRDHGGDDDQPVIYDQTIGDEEQRAYHRTGYFERYWTTYYDKHRTDPLLVEFVEKHPDKAGTLSVVDVPDDVEWQIMEYDGLEWVAEKHRTWY